MKKTVCVLASMLLVACFSTNVFAVTGGDQKVNAAVPGPSWELVIPADQNIPFRQESTDIVHWDCSIDNAVHIPKSKKINAYLTHTGIFTQDSGGSDADGTISFKLNDPQGNEVAAGTELLASTYYWVDDDEIAGPSFTNEVFGDIDMVISEEEWDKSKEGEYHSPVTYTSRLEDA